VQRFILTNTQRLDILTIEANTMKTQGANHKEYGHGVIVASRGYSAREPDFDTGKQSLNRLLVTEGVPLRKWTGIDGDNDDEQSPSE
jgi:hypothetical protein